MEMIKLCFEVVPAQHERLALNCDIDLAVSSVFVGPRVRSKLARWMSIFLPARFAPLLERGRLRFHSLDLAAVTGIPIRLLQPQQQIDNAVCRRDVHRGAARPYA